MTLPQDEPTTGDRIADFAEDVRTLAAAQNLTPGELWVAIDLIKHQMLRDIDE